MKKEDKNIEKSLLRIENALEMLAISNKKQFDVIDQRFDIIEQRLDTKADKKDIQRLGRLFGGHENRISRLEDNMQVVRGKLNFEG